VRRAYRTKRKPPSELPEPSALKELRTDEDATREALASLLGGMHMERAQLGSAQRRCPDLGPYVVVHAAWAAQSCPRKAFNACKSAGEEGFADKKLDSVLAGAETFEYVDGVLFRRVYDAAANEVQLRLAVPQARAGTFELPGVGRKPLNFRERILLDYHNGPLGGHQGRERTMEVLERDFWWPGMYEDVRRWCRTCEQCLAERGTSGVSAWARTELYSRPFRALQFDTVSCAAGTDTGAKYVLTGICCFSRWCWLNPIKDRTAETIAETLLVKVFLSMSMFPVVLRSDNAREFVSDCVASMNQALEIRHITGSSYHPQSQGMVESLHKTMNGVVRGLVLDHPEDWESRIPYAECILRMLPLKSLGGRSPYEVVTGLKPTLPRRWT